MSQAEPSKLPGLKKLQSRKPKVTRVCRSEFGEEKDTEKNSEDLQRSTHEYSAGYRSVHTRKGKTHPRLGEKPLETVAIAVQSPSHI